MESIGEAFPDILSAAQRKDGPAFELMWRTYSAAVVGYLRVQGATDPDDLVSEVFLGVFRSLREFEGNEQQFRAWIFTIAHRRLTDERRYRGRRPIENRNKSSEDFVGAELSSESEQRVRQLCGLLPDDQRDVMLLRLLGQLNINEVAMIFGRTQGAVKALQRRAFESLRQIVSSEGVPL